MTWSIADGRRGRRWREVSGPDGRVSRSLLFETDPDGRVVRLEIATSSGLLTLHPADDEAVLHGNVVTPDGIRHLALGEGTLLILGSPAAEAIAVGGLPTKLAVDQTAPVELVRIDDRLDPVRESWTVTRVDETTLRFVNAADGETRTVRLGADGLVELPGEVRWPLEL